MYHAQHLVTLELTHELQTHGLGLAAMKNHLNQIPANASLAWIASHSTMSAPWQADRTETMTETELTTRADHSLCDDELNVLSHDQTLNT